MKGRGRDEATALRASARITELLLVLGLLAGCAHLHCDAVVTRSSPVIASGAEEPAACACARRALPDRFHASEIDSVVERVAKCVGPAGSSALWENRACFPLELGTDAGNDEKVQLSFRCGDLCPDHAEIAIAYSRPRSEAECDQLGGMVEHEGIFDGYSRCLVPTPEACSAPPYSRK